MKHITNKNNDTLIITWCFTNTCNFKCSYCPSYLNNGEYGFLEYKKAIEFIKDVSKNNKKIYIELLGGEPTLWPKLIDFMKEIKQISSNIIVHIGTNGSRTTRWWQNFCNSDLEMNSFLAFSYHPELMDDNLYFSNLKIVSEKHFVVSSFMLEPKHIERTRKLFNKVKDNLAVDCAFKVIRPDFDSSKLDPNYTEDDLKIFNSPGYEFFYDRTKFSKKSNSIGDELPGNLYLNGEKQNFIKMIMDKKHNFHGWNCYAGSKRLYIWMDGTVWACSRVLGNKNLYLGNIHTDKIKLYDNHITCPIKFCSCKLDAIVEKFTNE